jgi:hypothetical protein
MWLRRTRMDISIELSASVVHQVRVISRCGRRRTRSAPLCARVDRARALRTDPCHHAAENASAYHRHATERVFPAQNEIPGHRGAYLLMRQTDDQVEFLAVTLWDSSNRLGNLPPMMLIVLWLSRKRAPSYQILMISSDTMKWRKLSHPSADETSRHV